MSLPDTRTTEETITENQERITEPPLYRVLLLNDDYTTMEFVVDILMTIFQKSLDEATTIMLNVHKKGAGICGVYPLEIAETKVEIVHAMAKENGYPLRCAIEKD
ncbi:MAG: ATP-dependent Clp protease adapter ClpS [Desulfatirhabdiaceae bacterium]